jgi:hypothetical protein
MGRPRDFRGEHWEFYRTKNHGREYDHTQRPARRDIAGYMINRRPIS